MLLKSDSADPKNQLLGRRLARGPERSEPGVSGGSHQVKKAHTNAQSKRAWGWGEGVWRFTPSEGVLVHFPRENSTQQVAIRNGPISQFHQLTIYYSLRMRLHNYY
jgi:hypothetical protein